MENEITKDTTMGIKSWYGYEKINEPIKSFLNQSVDYAILLNGEWGCGKTYYCDNILAKELKKDNEQRQIIRVSLFGKSSISEIWDDIIFRFTNENKASKLAIKASKFIKDNIGGSINFTNNEKGVGAQANLSSLFNMFNNITKNCIEGGIDKNKDNILLIFDDLERCNPDLLINILGWINYEFIENGYHILFVANEEELIKKSSDNSIDISLYNKWKEKVIRFTLKLPFNQEILTSFLKERYNSNTIMEKLNINFDKFGKIKNFRTWFFAFDVFNNLSIKIMKIINNSVEINIRQWENIFYSILLSIKYRDIKSKLNQDIEDFNLENLYSGNEQKDILDDLLLKDFYIDKYSNSVYKPRRYDFIKKYLEQGYVDDGFLLKELEKEFPLHDKYKNSFDILSMGDIEIDRLRENEYIDLINDLYNGVINNKYKIWEVCIICQFFNKLENDKNSNKYLRNDWKLQFKDYLMRWQKDIYLQFPIDYVNGFRSFENIIPKFSSYFKDTLEEILKNWIKRLEEDYKEKFNSFFIDQEPFIEENFYSVSRRFDEKLFEMICKYNLMLQLLKFDCPQIVFLKSYLRSSDEYKIYCDREGVYEYFNKISKFLRNSPVESFVSEKAYYSFMDICDHIDNKESY